MKWPGPTSFALALTLLAASACGGPTAPTGEPDYSGYIVDISTSTAFVRALDDECGIVLTLTPDTYYGVNGRSARRSDLGPALLVDVWVTGLIAESCPMQAVARAITVG